MTTVPLAPDRPGQLTVNLPGAAVTMGDGSAEIELFAETTDEQFSEALMLLPQRAELVSTTYTGGERMVFEW